MKLSDIPKEELEAMNYDDIAYIILREEKKKMKINELFKKVCDALELPDNLFEEKIADFFELLTTDKRFIMLEDGYWDLKEFHNPKVIVDDDEDDMIASEELEDQEEELEEGQEDDDIFYDTDSDDDLPEDELEDLVVIDGDDEEANS